MRRPSFRIEQRGARVLVWGGPENMEPVECDEAWAHGTTKFYPWYVTTDDPVSTRVGKHWTHHGQPKMMEDRDARL
jgi:hypothetical protein